MSKSQCYVHNISQHINQWNNVASLTIPINVSYLKKRWKITKLTQSSNIMYLNGFDNWFTPTQNTFHPTYASKWLKYIARMLNKLCSIIISVFYSCLWATSMLVICVIDYFSITGQKTLGLYPISSNFLIIHI